MTQTRLSVPPRTHMQTVWRVVLADGTVQWQCWTAAHDRNAPFRDMLGTFLELNPDGSARRVTYRPDDTLSVLDVMPNWRTE